MSAPVLGRGRKQRTEAIAGESVTDLISPSPSSTFLSVPYCIVLGLYVIIVAMVTIIANMIITIKAII